MKYVHESLAATGFAVLHHQVAMTLRPDMWNDGLTCRGELGATTTRNSLGGLNVPRYVANLAGVGVAIILARSPKQLPDRVEMVTGFNVNDIYPESELEGIPASLIERQAEQITERRQSQLDPYAGAKTANGPRSCSSCSQISAGHKCQSSAESGLQYPAANIPRRCLAYQARWDSHDARNGKQLWPELINFANGAQS